MDATRQLCIDTLLEEYRTLRTEVLACLSARLSILHAGFATLGVLSGAAIAAHSYAMPTASVLLLLLVPAASWTTLWTWLAEVRRGRRAGYHLWRLELAINSLIGYELLSWEIELHKEGSPKRIRIGHYHATAIVFSVTGGVALLAGTAIGLPSFVPAVPRFVLGLAVFVVAAAGAYLLAHRAVRRIQRDYTGEPTLPAHARTVPVMSIEEAMAFRKESAEPDATKP